jgi:hypothetical protein
VALSAHGIQANLPSGVEGRIFIRPSVGAAVSRPIAQFATFPIPEGIGDFGGNTNTSLGASDFFAVLFEYGPESLGKALFAAQGIPTSLTPSDFRPYLMRPGVGGSLGIQRFFSEAGRPFTFYARLGSVEQQDALVQRVNHLLGSLDIQPLSASTTTTPPAS